MPESRGPLPWLRNNWDWLLILSCLPLFAHKTAFNGPVAIMMIIGAVRTVRSPRTVFADPAVRLMSAVFLCFEVPILLSLPDAVHLDRALGTGLVDLRFWFMGVFVIATLKRADARRKLLVASGAVIGAWCLDAMLQYAVGRDLFGFPTLDGRITGVFSSLTLGAVTATSSPLLFELIRRHGARQKWLWLLLPALVAAVLLQGSRTGWMMLSVSVIVYGIYVLRAAAFPRRWLILAVLAAAVGIGLATIHGSFRQRVDQTMGLFGDYQAANEATSLRLSIWTVGVKVFEENWFNGIGPRGFRYIYDDYASASNAFVKQGQAPTHPHSMLLEIAIETGVIGLLGYVLMWALVLKRWRRHRDHAATEALPWFVATLVAWFPLNVHMAIYASYWSTIAWWLLLIALAIPVAEPRPRALHGNRVRIDSL